MTGDASSWNRALNFLVNIVVTGYWLCMAFRSTGPRRIKETEDVDYLMITIDQD